MKNIVISVEKLTKQYDLGVIGTGTLTRDLERWWARVRKQPDPYSTIGHKNAFERVGETILALDDISFTVNQGEALGIIGRNGAGKSTLLKILSRVTAPTSGNVKVKGRIGSLLEVGTGFHPELTGRENVYLNGAILGMRKDEVTRKFDEIVAFSGVERFIDTPVKRYSSGMYVRLAFAVAAHLNPEILIVDEVLAVGDAEFQKKCLGKMGDVAGEGRTVLFVSHNLVAIRKLCKHCILLGEGKIIVYDDTDRALETYSSKPADGILDIGNLDLFRPSWAKPFITSVELKNIKGETSSTFSSGETIVVEMSFINAEGYKISRPVMGLALVNKNSGVVGKANTRITGYEVLDFSKESAKFVASLKELPLTAGGYWFNVYLGDGEEDIDALLDILEFSVIPTDYYNTGKISTYDPGHIYISPDWKLLNE